MIYRLGVEDIEPNHWVVFVFDHPGCFGSGTTQEEALANTPAHIAEYFEWLTSYDCAQTARSELIATRVAEVFLSYPSSSDPDYIVNALFEDDCKPLTRGNVDAGLAIYDYAEHDLSVLVEKTPTAGLAQPLIGDNENSISKILDHIAWAEWWYFNRLDLGFPRSEMPRDPLEKLEKVQVQTRALLPDLIGDARVVEKVDEKWSARKVLRRTLWHVRDHTRQIGKILNLAKA